ncbi:hypothetical protein N9777_02660 [Ascidiaceihabitans sp.]|nr:hypothetical protein [Ascidiaceihabitans sp.]
MDIDDPTFFEQSSSNANVALGVLSRQIAAIIFYLFPLRLPLSGYQFGQYWGAFAQSYLPVGQGLSGCKEMHRWYLTVQVFQKFGL